MRRIPISQALAKKGKLPQLQPMRPPPRSLEEILYRKLLDSPTFNHWVRRVHAKINRIPYDPHPNSQNPYQPHLNQDNMKQVPLHSYIPTRMHKFNAFRAIWKDELKRSFGIRR